jgi:hypothetical protein
MGSMCYVHRINPVGIVDESRRDCGWVACVTFTGCRRNVLCEMHMLTTRMCEIGFVHIHRDSFIACLLRAKNYCEFL